MRHDACPIPAARLQHFARRIHTLGLRPLHELLRELVAGGNLLDRIEAFAEIDADVMRAIGADDLRRPAFVAGTDVERGRGV